MKIKLVFLGMCAAVLIEPVVFGQCEPGLYVIEVKATANAHQIRFLTQGCLSNGDFSADCTTPNGEARVTASLSPSRTSVRYTGTAFAGADSTWFASARQETVVKVRARGTLNLFFSANGAAPTIFNQLRNGDEMQMVFGVGAGLRNGSTNVTQSYQYTVEVVDPTAQNNIYNWTNSAGGEYSVSPNWSPNCDFPQNTATRSDTAIFSLAASTPIPIHAGNAAAAHWRVATQMEFSGTARVLGGSSADPSLTLDSGGSLLLTAGATLETADSVLGSTAADSRGALLTVSGNDALWKNFGTLAIGDTKDAALVIENGGVVVQIGPSGLEEIGIGSSAPNGRLVVRGIQNSGTAPSTLRTPFLRVGNQQAATAGDARIESGGLVDAEFFLVFNGTADVVGQNASTQGRSTAQISNSLIMTGPLGTELQIRDGGVIKCLTGSFGDGAGFPFGKVVVQGGSGRLPFDETNPLSGGALLAKFLFFSGQSEMIVEDNGVVVCTNNLILGKNAESLSKISVGDGSITAQEIIVGGDGQGFLDIMAGGKVQSLRGTVAGGTNPFSRGNVTIQSGLIDDAEWNVVGDLTVGGGPASGLTGLDVFKALVLLQARPILGTFTFSGATLRVGGQLTVDAHGAIAGNGILDAPNRNVVNGGFITPGLSPGKLIIQGNYEQLPAGTLLIEIAGLNQGQFDLLEVSGNTVLDGTLELRFLDGFLPKKDDIVAFLHVDGAVSGNFSRVAFPQLAPGFNATLNVSPDGSVRLTALANAVAGTGTAIISPTLTGNVAPHLNQVSITADQVVLSWTTTAGRNYQIEAKGNVKEASWSPLGPTVRAEGSLLTMQLSASGAERYYRVSEKP